MTLLGVLGSLCVILVSSGDLAEKSRKLKELKTNQRPNTYLDKYSNTL